MGILLGFPTAQDGQSAYELALQNGFVGTLQDWLNSLQGPAGQTPNLQIGTVTNTTGQPSANITGTPLNPVLNLTLKQGPAGPAGTTTIVHEYNKTLETNISTLVNTGNVLVINYTNAAKTPTVAYVVLKARNVGSIGGKWSARWEDNNGNVLLDNVVVYANNGGNFGDGGSGMDSQCLVAIPFVKNCRKITLSCTGPSTGYSATLISILDV